MLRCRAAMFIPNAAHLWPLTVHAHCCCNFLGHTNTINKRVDLLDCLLSVVERSYVCEKETVDAMDCMAALHYPVWDARKI
jgi:hypothetical protein